MKQECAMNEFEAKNLDEKIGEPMRNAADQAVAASRQVQDAAVEFANSSAEALKGHASHAIDAAKDVASEAQAQVQRKITEQKGVGADYVNNLADTMRRAANQFDADIPVAGTYIRKAAVQVENAADALRKGDFNDLVQGAQRFARDQPTAFFGLAFLAGFGAVRFLKSASGGSDTDGETRSPGEQGWPEPGAAIPNTSDESRRSM
jgi:hypothetical protein